MDAARFATAPVSVHISGLEVEGRHPRAPDGIYALSLNQVIALYAPSPTGPVAPCITARSE
jgi:hypothetical protein